MSVNTSKWLKFFSEAGLPSSVATNYAIIFTDHRIQNDMLCDITKEILYDMGIKTMGDVIAILRHAKTVHHETTRDKMLGTSVNEVGSTSRTTLPTSNRLSQPIVSRIKSDSPQVSTQNTTSSTISLKRSAEPSLKSTVPKIRRIVRPEEEVDDSNELTFGANTRLSLESLKTSSAKTSVFSRLGNEKNSETISSIFTRLGKSSSADALNLKRRVTISGNGINTSREPNVNVLKTDLHLSKRVVNTSHKNMISAPNTGGLRSTQTETLSVKNRIGINSNSSNIIATTNRMTRTVNPSNPSPAVAQARRLALRRAAGVTNKKTISLRKNIFDRLGPISL